MKKKYAKGTDNVPAMLTPREAILNRNAAELLGRDAIKRLNAHGNMLSKRGVDLASLPSDPTPGPSTENMLGYQMGTSMVQRDDRADLLRDADSTFYGGGAPMPTPTPTPVQRGYQYGTEDVRRRKINAASRARFTGILEPSPTGSYYNPARYANQGFSRPELNRIQRNLDNAYQQDLQYNRVANPRYQPEQDRGYSTEAAVGSGRASPATTQNYIKTYGFDVGGGNVGVYLPSGGFASVRRPTRNLGAGLPAGGNAPFAGEPTAPTPLGSTTVPQVPSGTATSQPFNTVPQIYRPEGPEMVAAPQTVAERIGGFIGSVSPTRAIAPILGGLSAAGQAIGGFGTGVYRGLTGQQTMQAAGGDIGGSGTQTPPPQQPMNPLDVVNQSTTFGQPRRYSDYY